MKKATYETATRVAHREHAFPNKLHFLFQRDRFDRELAEEMDFHREMLEAENTREGLAREAVGASARRQFGNTTLAGESSRDAWTIAWLETVVRDVLYGLRMLRRQPVFAAVAILSLALGIGANTATFTLAGVAIAAAMIPAERASRLDPLAVLRED